MAVEPTVEVSDTTVTVAHEGVEPMEDVEEEKVTPTKPTTSNADSGGIGDKTKKKKNSDRHKKKPEATAVNDAPKMMYAVKKAGSSTSDKVPTEETKKQPTQTSMASANRNKKQHQRVSINVEQTTTKTVAQ